MNPESPVPARVRGLVALVVVAAVILAAATFLAVALSRSDANQTAPDQTAAATSTVVPSATASAASSTPVPQPTQAAATPTARPATTAAPGQADVPPAAPSNLTASIVNWIPATCTITVDAVWKDNSNNETGFLLGPPSSKQVSFAGYILAPANATSARFTFTYGGGTFPVFIWAIRDTGSARLWSEVPAPGVFLTPTPATTCP